MDTKKIKIKVEQRESNGKKFNVYKTTTKNGRLMDVKFRKEVKELPTETCYAIIDIDNMNVDKNRDFPVLWVKAVESYETLTENSTEANRKAINEIF